MTISPVLCAKECRQNIVRRFAYDELNQLVRSAPVAKISTKVYNNNRNCARTDNLTAYGSMAITYDAIGNPLTYRGYTLTWQNGRQLASMRFGTVNIGFTYDVDGLRTSKNVYNVDLEHKYYYVGNRLQYETIGDSSALWYFYDADGNPSGIRYKDHNGTVNDYYFVCNWRGDVIQIYNAAGELVSTYDYDAWGRVSENSTDKDTQNIAEINPIRYRGYYYDSETGLYYLKSRYYDPAVKRFLNADGYVATGQSILGNNMFSYCDNNPVNREDPTGLFWKQLKAKVKNAWNGFKSWVNNTFGNGKKYYFQKKKPLSKVNCGLFAYETGLTSTVSTYSGNTSKRVTNYLTASLSNTGESNWELGISIKFSELSYLEFGAGLSNINISATSDIGQNSICVDFKTKTVEFTQSTTIEWDKGYSNSMYTSVSFNYSSLFYAYGYSTVPSFAPYGFPVPAF